VRAQISRAHVGEATQNGYAERVIRPIKEEEVQLSEYRDFHEAYQHIGGFIEDVYRRSRSRDNRKRIHSALGYLTPAEFEQHWRAQHELAF
jgi:transposase InsO family protein